MKICIHCKTENDNNAVVCYSCGSNQFNYICQNCGSIYNGNFCSNCGAKNITENKICPNCRTAYSSNACPQCGFMDNRVFYNAQQRFNFQNSNNQFRTSSNVQNIKKKSGCLSNILKIFVIFFLLFIFTPSWLGYNNRKKASKEEHISNTSTTINETTTVKTTKKIIESTTETNVVEVTENITENTEQHLYDNARVRNVMNGFRTEKLGEYAIIFADSHDCTEEALADIYFNYFEKNNFNWITLIYSDKNDNSGIYFSKGGSIVVNTLFEKDEYGDYSCKTSYNEILYYPNDDGTNIQKFN